MSPTLTTGLLINVAAIALNNSGTVSHSIVMAVQILAIVLMIIGLFQSRNVFKK